MLGVFGILGWCVFRSKEGADIDFPVWAKPAIYGVAIGAVVMTIVGFTWGGWVTGGTARRMAYTAAREASTRIVVSLCVNKFAAAPDAKARFTEFKENSWQRGNFIEKGGWARIPGIDIAVKGIASACANDLFAMEELPTTVELRNVATTPNES